MSTSAFQMMIQKIAQALPIPLLGLDVSFKVQMVNDSFCRLFQLERQTVHGQSVFKLGQGEWDLPELHALLDVHSTADHQINEVELEAQFAGLDRRLWLKIRRFLLQEYDALNFVIFEDITLQKQQELAAALSNERFFQAFRNSPSPILITNLDRRIIDVNDGWLQLFGFEAHEVIGHTPMELDLWGDMDEFSRLVQTLQENGILRDWEIQLRTKSGEIRVVLVSVSRMTIDNHNQLIFVTYDITDRKQAQQQRVELTLEREKVRLLKEFIEDASHDLRTPITTLRLNTFLSAKLVDSFVEQSEHLQHSIHMLASQELAENILEISRTAIDLRHRHELEASNILRLQNLVEDLLKMSELDTQANFEFQEHDLNQIVRRIISEIGLDATDKGISVEFDADETIPTLFIDQDEIARVVQNLLNNAIQYTESGGSIMLKTRSCGNEIIFEVSDTGIGISEVDIPHIFERFYRSDKARSAKTGGTGLGLAIAKKIVDAHHGRIEVSSRFREGSTFRVFLPN